MLNDLRNDSNFSFLSITKYLAKALYLIHSTKCEKKYGWITDKEVFEQNTFIGYLESELERFKSAVENNIAKNMLNIMIAKANKAITNLKKYEYKFKQQLIWFDLNPNNNFNKKEQTK